MKMVEKIGNVIITLGFSYIFDFFLHFHYNYNVFLSFSSFSSLPRRLERTVPMDCTTKYSLEEIVAPVGLAPLAPFDTHGFSQYK